MLLSGIGYQDRLTTVDASKQFFQILDLWNIVENNVRILGIMNQIILMVTFRGIEVFECIHPRDNGTAKHVGLSQLNDVGLCNLLL